MAFERYNKYIKNLVRDPHRPAINLANSSSQDVSARFHTFVASPLYDMYKAPRHSCTLSGHKFNLKLTKPLLGDLRLMGSNVFDENSCIGFPSANIMGCGFKAGEWGQYPRCGSVVTCVMDEGADARSLYARVINFFQVIDDDHCGYASVCWFSEPTYLYSDNPLGVRCGEDGSVLDGLCGSVIRITQIDPTQIMCEHDPTNNIYIMMWDSGWDTRRRSP